MILVHDDSDDDGDDDSDTLEHEIHVTLGALVGVTEKGSQREPLPDQPKDKDKDMGHICQKVSHPTPPSQRDGQPGFLV